MDRHSGPTYFRHTIWQDHILITDVFFLILRGEASAGKS